MFNLRAAAALSLILLPIYLPSAYSGTKDGVDVRWDPDHPSKKTAAVWLGYLVARCSYRLEHKLPPPSSGEIVPSFDEEVFARSLAARVYREHAGEKDSYDAYFADLAKVESKSFMREYVWTYLHRPEWRSSEHPAKLTAFQNWSRTNLKNHTPQIYGALAVARK